MGLLFKIKEAPKTLVDLLTLWVICTVWPGIIPAAMFFIGGHRAMWALLSAVIVGLMATLYIWKYNTELPTTEILRDPE